jgi:uncharacterized RDD family membrane protein YckC
METSHSSDLAQTQNTAVYAGFWLRVVAALVDVLAMCMPLVFAFFIVMFVAKLAHARKGYDPTIMFLVASPMAIIVGTWLYFAVLESSPWQATLGKKLLGLYVTDLHGQRLTRSRATGRTMAKYLSLMTAGIGYLLCGFTERKQPLHAWWLSVWFCADHDYCISGALRPLHSSS